MKSVEVLLSFIVVNYNGLSDTLALIDSIEHASLAFTYEIIVIDNGSAEEEFTAVKQQYPAVKGYYQHRNLGFAGGNNLAIDLAKGEYLYFINNDTILPGDASMQILNMIRFLEEHRDVGALSPKIRYWEPKEMLQFAGSTPLSALTLRNKQIGYRELDGGQYNQPHPIPYLHGAAMLLPARVVQEVGKLPEFYFLYYEELDWSVTIKKRYQIFYFPAAMIYHKESSSTGRESPLKMFYLTRNRLIYAMRNRKGTTRVGALLYLVIIAATWQSVRLLLRGELTLWRAHCKGIASGISWIQNTHQ